MTVSCSICCARGWSRRWPSISWRPSVRARWPRAALTPGWEEAMREHDVPDWYIESCRKIKYMFPKAHAVAYLMSAIRLMWFKLYHPQAFYAVYFTVRGDDIDYEAAVGGAAVARAHMNEVKRRLKEEKNAKDEDVLVSPPAGQRDAGARLRVPAHRAGQEPGLQAMWWRTARYACPSASLERSGRCRRRCAGKCRPSTARSISPSRNCSRPPALAAAILDRLRQVGALGDLPESSQVSFF